jgi:hypothetical protein
VTERRTTDAVLTITGGDYSPPQQSKPEQSPFRQRQAAAASVTTEPSLPHAGAGSLISELPVEHTIARTPAGVMVRATQRCCFMCAAVVESSVGKRWRQQGVAGAAGG